MNQKSKFHHKGTKDTKVRNRRSVKFDHSAYRAFPSLSRSWISAGSYKTFVFNLCDLRVLGRRSLPFYQPLSKKRGEVCFVVKSDLSELCASVVK